MPTHSPCATRALAGLFGIAIATAAMLALASRLAAGKPSDAYSGTGLARRAFRLGSARAGQHLAMDCFNRGDLPGYRR